MSSADQYSTAFAYRAQSDQGEAVSGTIDAPDIQEASRRLDSLRLRVLEVEPAPARAAVRARPLGSQDFIAFNQQLAHLAKAGLPIEQGLRLMAQDMRRGHLAQTTRQIAEELEKGRPLGEVFVEYRGRFPSLYGRLIDAGVKTGNLPGMLLNMGQHLELLARMREALWRAAAYPLMVMTALVIVMTFIGIVIIPKFEVIFRDFGTRLPGVTVLLLGLKDVLPWILIALFIVIIAGPLLWTAARALRVDRTIIDYLILPLPLFGAVLKRNLIARWCDVLRMGVEAGVDLPAAITLAGQAVGSPLLVRDGENLVRMLETGQALDRAGRGALLPATVVAAVELGVRNSDLASVLQTLSQMYQQQAELRLAALPAVLTPIFICVIAGVVVFVVMGLFAPLISLIQAVSGTGGKH